MRKPLIALFAAALALSLAACGGDDDDSASPGTTGQDSSESTDPPDDTEAPANGDDYSALLEKANNASYRVTYTNAASGSEDFTISQDPPNRALILGDDQRYVTNEDGTFLCDGSQCQEVPGGGADALTGLVQGFFGAYSALAGVDDSTGLGYDVEVTDDEEIAGRDARCAEISGGPFTEGQSAKVCADTETGVLLLAESGGADRIEATEFGEPEASDFEAVVAG
jgi:hypothetical protein